MKFRISDTVTLPLTFIGDIHIELRDSEIRDVLGHLYFREEISADLKCALQNLGHCPDQFKLHIEEN